MLSLSHEYEVFKTRYQPRDKSANQNELSYNL